MTFAQLSARLKNFLRGWLLVLGLKEGLVECATVCVKSEVILLSSLDVTNKLCEYAKPKIAHSEVSGSRAKRAFYVFSQWAFVVCR